MPGLPELQAMLRERILSPSPAAGGTGRLDALVDRGGRLDIYRNNTLLTLGEALRTTFPVVARLVGDDFFDFAARRFILAHPPERPCLSEYGDGLPDFLDHMPACAGLPYLGDVARLEWALNAVYTAPDEPALSPGRLAGLPEEVLASLTLRLVPSARCLTSRFPIDAIWRANQGDEAETCTISLADGAVDLLVLRLDEEAAMSALAPGEHHFLAALESGLPLGHAAMEAVIAAPAFNVTASLSRLLRLPVFAECDSFWAGETVP